jgi:hypothetical protein
MIMGMAVKYTPIKEKKGMNHIWRGIGCFLIVFALLASYLGSIFAVPPLVATGYVPLELLGHIQFPEWVSKVPVINALAGLISGFNNLGLGIVVFIVILVLLSGVFSLVFVGILQASGPSRYSEMDAPPSTHKAKRYKR